MRLHRLELAAFGPFPGREVVDFDALGADGLFLLHGETGAGKTTVLDAVAFALFGAVPGARDEAKRLRCDYADADEVTQVGLELTVQGQRLRVVRSPEYLRPKRRGGGHTKQNAKVSLTWIGPAPSGHTPEGLTRIDEVARTVQRLLGMSKEQFFQVVLLPQGDFARFLRADTSERETLLEKLFGTEHFARVEQWFRDRRQERRRDLDDARQSVRELTARIAQAAAVDAPDGGVPVDGWLDELVESVSVDSADAIGKATVATSARDRAELWLAESTVDAERVRRVRQASYELVELAGQESDRVAWRHELDAARRAIAVVAADQERLRIQRLVEQAELIERERGTEVEELGVAWSVDETDIAGLLDEVGRLREEAGQLTGLVAESDLQRGDQRALDQLAERIRLAQESAADLGTRLAELPERLVAARALLADAVAAVAARPGLVARRDELAGAVAAAGQLPSARLSVDRVRERHQTDVEAHQNARERLLDVRQRRLDGMAAELAAGLADGDPCPVCGSAEHPTRAGAHHSAVSPDDERRASQAEQRMLQARQGSAELVVEADQALATLMERLAGRDPAILGEEHSATVEQCRDADRLATAREDRRSAVEVLERQADDLRVMLGRTQAERAALVAERTTLAERVATRTLRLDEARGVHTDVAARRRHVLRVVGAVEALAEARRERSAVMVRLAEQDVVIDQAVTDAGFANRTRALDAARAETVIDKLESQLVEAQIREAAAKHVLADPEFFGIEPEMEIDLVGASAKAVAARESAERAVAVATASAARADAVLGLGEKLAAAVAGFAPIEAEFAELDGLTDVVNGRGQNTTHMSLRAYVLAARLEEVAVAATARLRRMSQGRYSFIHTDEAGARGTRGGLGLDVLDDYSGQTRSAKTLSGGESFVASLSLALGLADVVAAETGGALLDTLFVDEGFGGLDADTLDDVMGILDELRAGGRVVGLVSHVDELRQRIPVRLRVRKARGGSTLEVIC